MLPKYLVAFMLQRQNFANVVLVLSPVCYTLRKVFFSLSLFETSDNFSYVFHLFKPRKKLYNRSDKKLPLEVFFAWISSSECILKTLKLFDNENDLLFLKMISTSYKKTTNYLLKDLWFQYKIFENAPISLTHFSCV